MQYVYIHGFGTTGSGSKKFKMIESFAKESSSKAIALEWKPNDSNIVLQLKEQFEELVNTDEEICFIGSSTGGSFCLQLIDLLNLTKEYTCFLINPFLEINQRRIDDVRFPHSLAEQIVLPKLLKSKLYVILGEKDEVLYHQRTIELLKDKAIIKLIDNGNHSLNEVLSLQMKNYLKETVQLMYK